MSKEIYNFNLVEHCKRCDDEKPVNRFGLCKSCQEDVDYEYSMLYRIKTMED